VPVEEASIQATKKALKLLPPLYYATLKYLAAFLNRVQQVRLLLLLLLFLLHSSVVTL
jgi:hypothetical protein